jgi:hypothetical protein
VLGREPVLQNDDYATFADGGTPAAGIVNVPGRRLAVLQAADGNLVGMARTFLRPGERGPGER